MKVYGYVVTENGEVLSKRNGKPMGQHDNGRGYLHVKLYIHGDSTRSYWTVHRLVAMAHLPPPLPGQTIVRHLDGNPRNNHVSNLAWGTPQENMDDRIKHGNSGGGGELSASTRAGQKKAGLKFREWSAVTPEKVREIRSRASNGESYGSIAKSMNLHTSHVHQIATRKLWRKVA